VQPVQIDVSRQGQDLPSVAQSSGYRRGADSLEGTAGATDEWL
jgi:hypothetical protein